MARYYRDISKAIGPQRVVKETTEVRRRLTVRIPLWLKNLLDAAAAAASTSRAKVMQSLISKGLDLMGA